MVFSPEKGREDGEGKEEEEVCMYIRDFFFGGKWTKHEKVTGKREREGGIFAYRTRERGHRTSTSFISVTEYRVEFLPLRK